VSPALSAEALFASAGQASRIMCRNPPPGALPGPTYEPDASQLSISETLSWGFNG